MVLIKKADLDHRAPLAQLFDHYRVFYKNQTDIEKARDFIRERITRKDSEIPACFNDEGIMVGFAQLYPLFSSTRMRKLWLLNDLYVEQHQRGPGYSKLLIEKAKELCRETNAAGLILETSKQNMIGNNLYPATGFVLDKEHNFYSWDNV